MDKIKVRDRNFSVSIPEAKIKARVAEIASQISKDLKDKKPLFLAVLNGSFIFAADLMRGIDTPCEITFVRMASYEGTASTGKVHQLIGLKDDIKDRTVVIIEDIIDSGLTMKSNLKVDLDLPYCCFEIPNDFIVGYGLDYDGEGRNLPSIYTVTD